MNSTNTKRAPAHAVVVGLDTINGIQTARILAGHGIPVIAVAMDPKHRYARTRVCEEIVTANWREEDLIEALAQLGSRLDEKAVLYPCNDPNVLLVSRHREKLAPWFHVALPAKDAVETAMDKTRFYGYAESKGLSIPRTLTIESVQELKQAAAELTFPCVVKPSLKSSQWDRQSADKVVLVADRGELESRYQRLSQGAPALVVQEWVVGKPSDLYSCNCYFDARSRPLASFVARKIRQWPPDTGSSTSGVECRNDVVRDQTIALFKDLKLHGLGYLEMKQDARTGQHFIIEPSIGRPTGRSAIAEAGGVDLLYTMYCDVLGLPLPDNRTQAYGGVKWLDLRLDLQSALVHWRRGELTFLGWLRSIRGRKVHALLSWRDPGPFLSDLWYAAKKTVRTIATRRRGPK